MKVLPRLLYLCCFGGLGAVAALAFNQAVQPSMSAVLLRAVFFAAVCGAPGLVWRKLWPLAIVLLPVGCYLALRTSVPLPPTVEGFTEQLRFYAEQLQQGSVTYQAALFPLAVNDFPELQVLLAFSAYWLLGMAAFVALSLRRAVPAVVLLLVLVGYGLTVDVASRVLWPALLFVVLSVCLIVACRGLMRRSWRLRDVVAGGAVGIVGSLLSLALLVGAPSVVATPWQDWRTWDPFGQSGSVYTFNWLQNYPRLLDPTNNVVIMRVQSPLPSYWRANALDTFTGTAWVTSQAFLFRIDPAAGDAGGYAFSLPPTELMPTGQTVTEVFQVQDVYTNYFFTGGDPQTLAIEQDISLRMNHMRSLRVSKALGPTLDYSLTAVIPQVEPADLVGLGTDYPDEVGRYRTLPWGNIADLEGPDKEAAWRGKLESSGADGWEWTELYSLNSRVIGDATDPYQIALRIERYLRQYYEYTVAPPSSQYSSPYAAFLFDTRAGYCQHFAGAMALLLRYNGIPSRVAVGFSAGSADTDRQYLVSTNNAHAWVEAYVPQVGWVAFDPTRGRNIPTAGPSSTSPGFVDPFDETVAPGSTTDDTLVPRTTLPDGTPTGETPTSSGKERWLSRVAWLPWVAGLVVVLGGWPLVRGLWRRRRLHRGPPEQRLEASLRLLRADLADYGVPATPAHTLEEALQVVQTRLGVDPDQGLVARADAVLFGGRVATAEDVGRAESFRNHVKTRLRRRGGWLTTLRTWYGVPQMASGGSRRA
jgi:transglutaminase-like putative cysteine protease